MLEHADTTELFAQHGQALLQWANTQTPSWIRSKVEPVDLVQQTLLEALKEKERLVGLSATTQLSYLRRALMNNLIDAARKYTRQRDDISPEACAVSSARLVEWLAADHSTPSERVARNERYATLAVSLSLLPDDQRIAIEMRYLQSATVGEIAQVLQRSVGAVSALLRRAVFALRSDRHLLDS